MEDQEVHADPPGPAELNSRPSAARGGLGGGAAKHSPNRFCLDFGKETNKEIEQRKLLAKTTLTTPVPEVMEL